jgi:hypothetical protein
LSALSLILQSRHDFGTEFFGEGEAMFETKTLGSVLFQLFIAKVIKTSASNIHKNGIANSFIFELLKNKYFKKFYFLKIEIFR